MIKDIVFDFGGVLIDWNPRHAFRSYFNDEERMEFFLTHICSPEWNARHDRGVSFAENAAALKAAHPEWAEAIELYHTRWTDMLGGQIDGGVSLLRDVKAAGYRVWGLTNWSAETFPYTFSRFDFLSELDGIVVSGEEKMAKPDAEIFRTLLERYNLAPEECVFIDDSPTNVAAAGAVGMRTVLYTDAATVRQQLEELGVGLK